MTQKKTIIFFGAGGAGENYVKNTKIKPNFFLDNDPKKWGKALLGIEIKKPTRQCFSDGSVIHITSERAKEIKKQLIKIGLREKDIIAPPKHLLGGQAFSKRENRKKAAELIHAIAKGLKPQNKVVAVMGTALGIHRDSDFIPWDFDIDLSAPSSASGKILENLKSFDQRAQISEDKIFANIEIEQGTIIPVSVALFDEKKAYFIERALGYEWRWPIEMFTNCTEGKIYNLTINLPNPPEKYLESVYGKNWKKPNRSFTNLNYNAK